MTKIGDQKPVVIGTRGAEAGAGTRQEQVSFARSLDRAPMPSSPHPMALPSVSLGSSQRLQAPPAYDATQSVDFRTVAGLVANSSPACAETMDALSSGLSDSQLPNVVVIAGSEGSSPSAIISVGRNIFIPAPVHAAWQAAGMADADGAARFMSAYSAVVARTAHINA